MTYNQSQYDELLDMFVAPVVVLRGNTIVSSNHLAKDKYRTPGSTPVVVRINSSEAEIDGEKYGAAALLTDGSTLYFSKDIAFTDSIHSLLTRINSPVREVTGTSLASLQLIKERLSGVDSATRQEILMLMNMLRKSQFQLIRAADNLAEAITTSDKQELLRSTEFNAVNIRALVSALITSVKLLFDKGKVNLKYQDNLDDDVITEGNAIRIENMIVNLLSNALMYSSPVGSPIEVVLNKRNDEIAIDVINFCKISGDTSSFFRFCDRKSNAAGSAGLGLSSALKIAQLHGGTILITSDDGKVCVTATLAINRPIRSELNDITADYGDEAARRLVIGLSGVLPREKCGVPFLDL
jgi:signal transduction histidine kinase